MAKSHCFPDEFMPSPATAVKDARNRCIDAFIEQMGWDWRRWSNVHKFYWQHAEPPARLIAAC